MRVVFCGNPEFALPTLDALLAGPHEVAAVVCSPDKPRGRGRKISPLPVKERALAAGLDVFQPASLKDPEFLARVKSLQPDCLTVVAFRILPRELFAMPRHGSFNVHPSLLPRGRGPAPIRWTLMRGETETGVTIIHLSETIDGGAILAQEKTAVHPEENFGTLHDRLAPIGARMLVSVLTAFESGTPPQPIVQDESLVTKAPKLTAADFVLDWSLSSTELRNKIRALSPNPGAVTVCNGQRLKILEAEEIPERDGVGPGELNDTRAAGLSVGTGTGELRLKVVQPEGRRAMTIAEFLRGCRSLPAKLGN